MWTLADTFLAPDGMKVLSVALRYNKSRGTEPDLGF